MQLGGIKKFISGSAVIALLLATFAAPAQDDYLGILAAEADDTGANSAAAGSPDVATKDVTQSTRVNYIKADKVIESGLDFDAFEEVLDERYSGSYFLYRKLSARNRQKVYKFYMDDNQITAVREEIVRRLSSGH